MSIKPLDRRRSACRLAGRRAALLCLQLLSAAASSAAGCRKSASTPASPAPTWMARWPRRLHLLRQPQLQPQPAAAAAGDSASRSTTASAACKRRYDVDHFLAYFQPATNTYAPVERLRPLYEAGLAHPRSSAWPSAPGPTACRTTCSICSTRSPSRTYLSVEYGLQTIHDRSLDWMNRGHHHDAFLDAIERSRGRGFEICAT